MYRMRHFARPMLVVLIVPFLMLASGCEQSAQVLNGPQRTPRTLFTLETNVGMVPVISFVNTSDTSREITIDASGTGLTGNRTIAIEKSEDRNGIIHEQYEIRTADGTPTYQITRKGKDGGAKLDVSLSAGGERMDITSKVVDGVLYEHYRYTDANGNLHSMRLNSRMPASERHTISTQFYAEGPLLNNPESELMMSVVFSQDWEYYLVPVEHDGVYGTAGDNDDNVDRNIRRMCTTARVLAGLSSKCLAISWCWVVFVPSAGISAACAGMDLYKAWSDDEGDDNEASMGGGTGGGSNNGGGDGSGGGGSW